MLDTFSGSTKVFYYFVNHLFIQSGKLREEAKSLIKTFKNMKKKSEDHFLVPLKVLRIMKITTLLLLIGILHVSASAYAQSQRISVEIKNGTFYDVISQIEKQSDFMFFYNSNDIDNNQHISIQAKDQLVTDILNEIIKNNNLAYKVTGKHIVITRIPAIAQQTHRLITGTVTDENGDPIIGTNVVEKGTTNGIITDMDGKFALSVNDNAVLQISYIGYIAQEIRVGNQTTLSIQLKEDSQVLEEVVVVGFATQKKVNLTGAVGVADAKALEQRPVMTAAQALQGLVPGLIISQSSGKVGDRASINIRGTTTISDGSTGNPLILIDGMEGDLNAINPQDIENISVLKDAAASSIYGSRAPFGVILVTTKKGTAGKLSINYNNSFRWSDPINLPTFEDSYSYAWYFNEAYMNAGAGTYYNDETMQRILDFQQGKITTTMPKPANGTKWETLSPFQYGNDNNEWYDITYRSWVPTQEHNLSASGGTKEANYYFSANYLGQNGLLTYGQDKYRRYTTTAKVNTQLGKYIELAYSNRFIREEEEQPSALTDDLLRRTAYSAPIVPLYDPNGYLWDGLTRVLALKEGGRNQKKTDWLYQQLRLTAEFIKDWKIYGDVNYRTKNYDEHSHQLMIYKHDVNGDPYVHTKDNSVYEGYQKQHYWNINIYSDYTKSFEKGHTFKVMAGFQTELLKQKSFNGSRVGVILDDLPELNLTTGFDYDGNAVTPTLNQDKREWATAGFFGRLNYDYKERYLLEVNLRYDGTSRFRADSRWGVFPSVSAGWNIAREKFMENKPDIVNLLKLRASYGMLGNQNTSLWYPTYELMSVNTSAGSWLVNGVKPNISNAPSLIYSDLTWETVSTWNMGIDFGLLKNRLSGSFDYYIRKTEDMVGPAPELPVILGTSVPKMNNTDLKTYGWELSLSWKDRIADKLNYGVTLSLNDSQTEITNYPNSTGALTTYREGQILGEIWGYQTIGVAKTQEEMNAHLAVADQSSLGSMWSAGDIMYADLDGDGKVNNGKNLLSDHGDLVKIGSTTPRYRFGLDLTGSYNGFNFRVFFQGIMKRDFMPNKQNVLFWGMTESRWFSSYLKGQSDYFRPEDTENPLGPNLDSYFPRPIKDNGKNLNTQSQYLQSAAYIRLKNIQIGYNFPKTIVNRIGLSNVRIYVTGDNLWTGTKLFKTLDPEQIDNVSYSVQGANYPLTKVIATGINVTF